MKTTSLKNGLSTIVIILITVVTTAVLVGGGMFFFQKNNKKTNDVVEVKKPSPTPEDAGLTLTDIDPTVSAENKTSGKLEGTFIFPGEGIPKTMKACAENVDTAEVICSGTLHETGFNNTFSFEVPAGDYYVYSQSGIEGEADTKAYYTEFVTCGLLATCPSHKKIIVTVEENETVSDIKPHDWYEVTPTP